MRKLEKRFHQAYPFLAIAAIVYMTVSLLNRQHEHNIARRHAYESRFSQPHTHFSEPRTPFSDLRTHISEPKRLLNHSQTKHPSNIVKQGKEQRRDKFKSKQTKDYMNKLNKITNNTPVKPWNDENFEKLKGVDIFVKSAYYDMRNDHNVRLIRVWMLAPRQFATQLYCHVRWDREYGRTETSVVKASLRLQNENVRPFCKYITGVVECEWNEGFLPRFVSVSPAESEMLSHWHQVKLINPPSQPPSKIAICLKTLFDQGSRDLGLLMEWFELNKILGVDQVIMYGYNNISPDILRLVKHYQKTGYVTMKDWNLPVQTYTKNIYKNKTTNPAFRNLVKRTLTNNSDIPCVRYHAQHLTYMDCLYENMHRYAYLLYIDVDEYIMPTKHNTLKELLKELDASKSNDKTSSYVFEEACFDTHMTPLVVKGSNNVSVVTSSYKRGPFKSDHIHKAMKSVVRPRFTKNMHIHRVSGLNPALYGYRPLTFINQTIAKLHHYKASGRCSPYNVTDKAAAKYQTQLTGSIRKTWNDIFAT